jgi:hypothetical protein
MRKLICVSYSQGLARKHARPAMRALPVAGAAGPTCAPGRLFHWTFLTKQALLGGEE